MFKQMLMYSCNRTLHSKEKEWTAVGNNMGESHSIMVRERNQMLKNTYSGSITMKFKNR